ncbi:hypothetical protein CBF27_01620 [Vagococcus acidifermentans]|uniref:DNA-binding response regulator n=1 Tax=Vagococcus acidifermentans TaxID=564710 RepID=A0A430B391_9ENTE|nr:hypothetical protein CBF27_01620 [Vagococcus acidifermentans]
MGRHNGIIENPISGKGGVQLKLLIVDDEKLILKGIKQLIEQANLKLTDIYLANSGQEALAIFQKERPEIVMTDIRMPKMSGLDLIKEMKKLPIPFKSIIISSYDDFSYAKEGILLGIENYLIKPINQTELIQTIQETLDKITNERSHKQLWTTDEKEIFKDNFFRRLIQNNLVEHDFDNWSELLKPFDNWHEIAVVTIKWQSSLAPEYKDELILQLKAAMPDGLVINISSEELALLCQYDSRLQTRLTSRLEQLFFFRELFVTIGTPVTIANESHISYDSAQKLQSYSLVFGFGKIVSEHDIKKNAQLTERLISHEELTELIHQQSLASVKSKFLQLEAAIKQTQLSPSSIQNITIGIGLMLYRISVDAGISDDDEITFLRALIGKITQKKTTQEIFALLLADAEQLIARLQLSQTTVSPIIQRMLRMVEKDLSIHYSLKDLADHFNMNPAYLGQLFQKEIGTSYNQYCHQLRLKQANEQIIQTDKSIRQISKELGYEDISYFYRLYKKEYGFTPNKARANKLLYHGVNNVQ